MKKFNFLLMISLFAYLALIFSSCEEGDDDNANFSKPLNNAIDPNEVVMTSNVASITITFPDEPGDSEIFYF